MGRNVGGHFLVRMCYWYHWVPYKEQVITCTYLQYIFVRFYYLFRWGPKSVQQKKADDDVTD
jgi:hypothetical protein